ncbi:MAG: glycoside hydrolase family 13 protein [Oscillospiraceae bacterium]|nr:glycoside hydrolase family 13 protein [Oscillospiraceae bacterium]
MIFASRSPAHKTPFGAVKAGQQVAFTLTPPRRLSWLDVFLCVSDEFASHDFEQKLHWDGLELDADRYSGVLDTSGMLGPIWYWFRYTTTSGASGIFHNPEHLPFGEGRQGSGEPAPFQLTVTDPGGTPIPDWYGKGITYHIFPDRFRRTKIPSPDGMVGVRRVHRDWGSCPEFRPDENGEVKNCDFFGGSIAGVLEKLSYIHSLGVRTIYFSPIFEAASNHRYDTACYTRIDPMFGTQEEFEELCASAAELGMKIMLDGVFNHTGFDSVYFNGRGTYELPGAYQSKDSPYYEWYNFISWPEEYSSWWGIYTLPDVNEGSESYRDFIYRSPSSVVRRWLKAGASAWRLDVADEMPDDFIEELREAARQEKDDAVIIGEVWEDASNKIAYSTRRRYLLGHELDGVMNYPFRNSLLAYILGGRAEGFRDDMERLRENYPRDAYFSLMNTLGTHDTPRILTVLGADSDSWELSKEERSICTLSPRQYDIAIKRLKMASAVLYAFPGSPCILYGDEVGLEGFEDPFNRRTYPWGSENKELLDWYLRLGKARNISQALQSGDIQYLHADNELLCFFRTFGNSRALLCVNRGNVRRTIRADWHGGRAPVDILSDHMCRRRNQVVEVTLEPMSARLLLTLPEKRGG